MEIKPGNTGQYDVFVDGRKVIGKTWSGFPSDAAVVAAVRKAAGGS